MDFNNLNSPQQPIVPVEGDFLKAKYDLDILGISPKSLQAPLYNQENIFTQLPLNINQNQQISDFNDNDNLFSLRVPSISNPIISSAARDSITGLELSPQEASKWQHDPLLTANSSYLSAMRATVREIVFIDTNIDNYQSIVTKVAPGAEVITLDATKDGVYQISELLSQRSSVTGIHIISHGDSGSLQLGNTQLTQENLSDYNVALQNWARALTSDADILFYGCDVAEDTSGQAFITQLSKLTGADIAASKDLTGSGNLGSNWVLEYQTGAIETQTFAADNSFTSVLGTVTFKDGTLQFNGEDGQANKLTIFLSNDKNSLIIRDENYLTNVGIGVNQVNGDQNAVSISLATLKSGYNFKILGNVGDDEVTFRTNLFLKGGNLDVVAEKITVDNNVIISTRNFSGSESEYATAKSSGNSGTVKFTAEGDYDILDTSLSSNKERSINLNIGSQILTNTINVSGSNYSAGDITFKADLYAGNLVSMLTGFGIDFTPDTVSITLTDATLKGNNITLEANVKTNASLKEALVQKLEGEDVNSFWDGVGDLFTNNLASIGGNIFGSSLSLPLQIVHQNAKAEISIQGNTNIESSGDVEIKAETSVDSTIQAVTGGLVTQGLAYLTTGGQSILQKFSIAYSGAVATANTLIGSDVVINAQENVNITAKADATASATARTTNRLLQGQSATNDTWAVSFGLAYSDVNALTQISQGAAITSQKNINVKALGNSKTEGSAEVALYDDGKAGITLGLGIALGDVKATVDGSLTAKGDGDTDNEPELTFQEKTAGLKDGDKVTTAGIGVYAYLTSEDSASATSGLRGDPNWSDKISFGELQGVNVAQKFSSAGSNATKSANQNNQNVSQATQQAGTNDSGGNQLSGLQGTGATAISVVNNDVLVEVGGILKSGKDISIKANQEQKVQNNVESVAADDPSKPDEGNDQALALGVSVGVYSNDVQAVVKGTAQIDAKEKIDIGSTLTYPWLTDLSDEQTYFDLAKDLQGTAGSFLDGKLGLTGLFLNSFTRSYGQALDANSDNNIAIAGSINVAIYNDTSKATIQSGARINQDTTYQTNNQSVDIAASTEMKLMNMTGIFDINLNENVINAAKGKDSWASVLNYGADGVRKGAGGSLFVAVMDNDTFATVEDGVLIHAGADGALNVKGNADILHVSLTQAGSQGSDFALAGSIGFIYQNSNTHASLGTGVKVTGGSDVTVEAIDDTTHINVVGSVATGGGSGSVIGVSVGINTISRDTQAFIGTPDTQAAGTKGTNINAKNLKLNAQSDGVVVTVGLAGSKSSSQKPPEQQASQPQNDPNADPLDGTDIQPLFSDLDGALDGESLPGLFNEGQSDFNNSTKQKPSQKYGLGISGVVNFNLITDNTKAFINDAGTVKAKKLDLISGNNTNLIAIGGSVALSSNASGDTFQKSSNGIAGAVGINILTGETSSFIKEANLDIEETLTQRAIRDGDIVAVNAGAAGGTDNPGTQVAGSVAVNIIDYDTLAYADGVKGKIKGKTTLEARDGSNAPNEGEYTIGKSGSSSIWAIAGSASYSSDNGRGKASNGFGVGISFNSIKGDTKAEIRNSNLTHNGIELNATSDNDIRSITASLGVSKSSTSGGIGAAGTFSWNSLSNSTTASIQNSTLSGTGNITLTSEGKSDIFAISGGIGVSAGGGQGKGIGAGIAVNLLRNKNNAYIDKSSIITNGALSLTANSTGSIVALTAGIAFSGSQGGLSFAGSVAVNNIANDVTAYISNSPLINTQGGNVTLRATDDSVIQSVSGGIAVSGGNSIGASIGVNIIKNNILSYIDNSTITQAGALSLASTSTSQIDLLSVGGSIGNNFALGGSVSVNVINNTIASYITNGSNVTANSNINLAASDQSMTNSLSGGLAFAKSGSAVGAAIAVNVTSNNVLAYIGDRNPKDQISTSKPGSTVTSNNGSLTIQATSTALVNSVALGGSGGTQIAVGGSVTVNILNNKLESSIKGNSKVTAKNNIELKANQPEQVKPGNWFSRASAFIATPLDNEDIPKQGINSLAGGIGISKGGTGIGASVAINIINNKFHTFIDNSTVKSTNGSILLDANLKTEINAITIGGAGGKVAVAGSVSVNRINTVTDAHISNNSTVNAAQQVKLTATDNSKIESIAGQISIGGKVGVGAAVSTNYINNKVNAFISGQTTATANSVSLKADLNALIRNATVGGTGAGTFAAGGAVSVNNINTVTNAHITNAKVQAAQLVDISATDYSKIESLAGQLTVGGTAAIGASVSTNNVGNKVQSYISGSQVTANVITVKSNLTAGISNITAGGTGAGTFAAGGSVTVNNIKTTTSAYISNNATVQTQQNVEVLATNIATIKSLAGQANASGTAAVGAAVAVNNSSSTTEAYINSSNITSTAGQVKILATGAETIESLSAGASVAGAVALTGSVSVNNITNTISAYALNANVSASSLEISAKDTATIKSLAGQISVGIKGGVGAAVAYNNIGNTVKAYAQDSTINTAGNVLINANGEGTIETIAVGGAAGLFVGLGGSVAVNEMSNKVSAYIQGGNLRATGSVGVLANSVNSMDTKGGTASAGLAGVGATIVVNNLNNSTQAYLSGANVNALGNQSVTVSKADGSGGTEVMQGLAVIATSEEDLEVTIGTASAGALGFAASIAVNSFKDTTQTYISGGSINSNNTGANAEQSVVVKAFNDSNVDVKAGAGAIGAGGVGATIDVTTVKNGTSAFIDNASVNALKNVNVEAKAKKDVNSLVVAAAGGKGLGVSGAVSVVNVSGGMSSDALTAADDTKDKVNKQLSDIDGMGKDSQGNQNIRTKKDIVNDLSSNPGAIQGTTAFISGSINAGGQINIISDETTKLGITSGALALGGLLGAGGSVGIANITHNTSAYVGANANLTVGSNLNILATGLVDSSKVQTIAGTAGLVGLGAAVSYLTSNNNTNAYIDSGTRINKANNINVTAGSSSNLKAEGWGASVGAAAVGVVIANTKESGTTQAYLGNGVQIQNANSLNVNATAKEAVSAISQSAAGGIISGNGSVPTATVSPTVKAYVGDNAKIQVAQDVQIVSDVTLDGDAEAKGVSIGAIAVGVSIAEVNVNPNINTYIGSSSIIEANNVTVESRLGKPITVSDTSLDPKSAVNNGKNTITFNSERGLKTGDQVVYTNGGGSDINGLKNQSSYNVIAVDSKTVKLGSEFNATQVDVKFNTIKFGSNHSFRDGDKVVYEASGGSAVGGLVSGNTYYVKVIDSSTIKLTANPSSTPITKETGITNINTVGLDTVIGINNHGFQNGDTVSYQQRSAQFIVVKEIPQDAQSNSVLNLSTDVTAENTIKSANHGFADGDEVTYSTTETALGGLTSGQTYYLIKVDDDNFRLSTTRYGQAIDITSAALNSSHKITATGLKVQEVEQLNFSYTDDTVNTNTITVNNHGFTTGQQVTYKASGTALTGLMTETTYYIIQVNSNQFKLASSLINAENDIGIDFGSDTNSHQLIFTKGLKELEPGVSYYVIGATQNSFKLANSKGGAALKLSLSDAISMGLNHLFTKEDVIDLTATSTGTHNIHFDIDNSTATGNKHLLSTGATATVPSQGDNKFSAYAEASAGGLIGGNATLATLNITPTMNTYVGNSVSITAKGNVSVTSLSSVEVTGATESDVLGAIAVGASKINVTVNNTNNTDVGFSAQIKAQGNVNVTGLSNQTLNVSASGAAGSAITFADADAHASVTNNTTTTIKNGANITSNDTLLVRSASNTNGIILAFGNGIGLYGDADGDSSFKFDGSNTTNINDNVRLEARSLTVEAVVDTLNPGALSMASGGGFIGNIDAHAKVDLTGSDVTVYIGSGAYLKGDNVTLDAKYKNVNSSAIALAACASFGGDTDSEVTNIMPLTAKVFTDANSTIEVYKLNVISDFENFNSISVAESKKLLFDFGSESKDEKYTPTPIIHFNSNVILNRRDVNPVLIIDQNGVVVQQSQNVTVNVTATDITVNSIDNTKVGDVNFIIPSRTPEMAKNGQFTDRGKYTIVDPAYDTVQLENSSNKNFVINNMSVINSVGMPQIKYDQVKVNNKTIATTNLTPPNILPVNPTVVTITNKGNSDLILQGVIDNPHDSTVLYSQGNIFSRGTNQKIITRDLKITALGSIGANGQRIIAQLNQGYAPVTSDVSSHNISLDTTAQNSIFLDLTAQQLDSNPVTVDVKTMTSSAGDVNIAIRQTTNNSNTAVAALYDFTKIIAGGDIIIDAGTTTTNIKGNTDFLNNTAFSDGAALTNIDGKTASGVKGLLDVVTGGYIDLTEVAGGVNLKQAVSANDFIQLTVIEASNLGEDLLLVDGAKVSAAKDVTFLVGDNFQINSTAEIKAGGNVVIKADYGNQDTEGTLVNIFGWIYANRMEIYGDRDNDNFNIHKLATTTNLWARAGNDTINIGDFKQIADNIAATLFVSGGIGRDTLNVDDSGDVTDNTAYLTDTQINALGMTGTVDYGNIDYVNLKLGSGNDIVVVESTHNGQTNIETTSGNDTVYVESINGETTVRGGAGDDNITVSNFEQIADNIAATLFVSGGIGRDTLNVDDSGDATDNTAYITDTQVNGLGITGTIDYGNIDSVNVRLGSGSDIVVVESTHNGQTNIETTSGNDTVYVESINGETTVRGGADDDNITISNSEQTVENIAATLFVSGGIGRDTLNVDDSGDATDTTAYVSDTQINGLGMTGTIDYGNIDSVNVRLGSGSDIVVVESTHNGQTNIETTSGNDTVYVESINGETRVRGGAGNDNITVSNSEQIADNIAATLFVSGGIGNDTLNVDDSGDATDNTAYVSDTQINGLGITGTIDYGNIDSVNVQLGSGSDIVVVESTHNGQTNIETTNGNDTVYVESINGETTVRGGAGDDNITVSNSEQTVENIAAKLFVSGGVGRDTLNVDDSGDATDNTAYVSDTQINGLGITGTIDYGNIDSVNVQLGSGSDIVVVESTHNGQTNIETTNGNDTVYVESINGETTVRGGAGDDNITVSNSEQTVENIAAKLFVSGGVGRDTLNVDDSGDVTDSTAYVSDTQINGLGITGTIDYGNIDSVNVQLGSGEDIVVVEAISADTSIMTGLGNDTVYLDDPNQLLAILSVDGQKRN
ncbi:MAG: DUF4347 domain-containing protein [Calothrix sp. FI2-JRJ7]|jgi:hypothetical protein|nr:DUF4347 domain-containing protein [Calothrix sp. FI2-JRJ7]